MRENPLRTLTEASRAAMPARERNWEVVSRWINPRACLAPLLVGTLVLSAPSGAAAGDNYVKSMDLDLTSGEVRILSSDDETYDTIQDGEVGFTARFGIDLRRPGAFDGIAIHLGECTGHGGECYTKPLIFSTTAAGRDFFTERTFTESSGGIATTATRQAMFAACNAKKDEAQGAGDDVTTQLDVGATLAVDTRISHNEHLVEPGAGLASHGLGLGEYSKTKTFPFKLRLACVALPTHRDDGPKPASVDIRVKQTGNTCPKDAEVSAFIDYEKPMTGRFKVIHNGKPGQTIEIKAREVSLAGKTGYRIERLERYTLDPGKHDFQIKVIGGGQSEKRTIDVECPPFQVISAWLKYDVEDKATCPKKVVETATFYTEPSRHGALSRSSTIAGSCSAPARSRPRKTRWR